MSTFLVVNNNSIETQTSASEPYLKVEDGYLQLTTETSAQGAATLSNSTTTYVVVAQSTAQTTLTTATISTTYYANVRADIYSLTGLTNYTTIEASITYSKSGASQTYSIIYDYSNTTSVSAYAFTRINFTSMSRISPVYSKTLIIWATGPQATVLNAVSEYDTNYALDITQQVPFKRIMLYPADIISSSSIYTTFRYIRCDYSSFVRMTVTSENIPFNSYRTTKLAGTATTSSSGTCVTTTTIQ